MNDHQILISQSHLNLPRLRINHQEKKIMVPPINFAVVEDQIYRSGHPVPINFSFLETLKLKTVIYLSEKPKEKSKDKDEKKKESKDRSKKEIQAAYREWAEVNGVTIHDIVLDAVKEPFFYSGKPSAEYDGPEDVPGYQKEFHDAIEAALKLLVDKRNFPILVHSDKGKHRVGLLVAIMRKLLQGWCLSGIFDEYSKFALGKSDVDNEFIEWFECEIECEEQHIPQFVRFDVQNEGGDGA